MRAIILSLCNLLFRSGASQRLDVDLRVVKNKPAEGGNHDGFIVAADG